jgi:hypothetical protein
MNRSHPDPPTDRILPSLLALATMAKHTSKRAAAAGKTDLGAALEDSAAKRDRKERKRAKKEREAQQSKKAKGSKASTTRKASSPASSPAKSTHEDGA